MNNLKFLHQKSYDNFHSPYSGGIMSKLMTQILKSKKVDKLTEEITIKIFS